MFPEDFFGNPSQYTTIQTQQNKAREHPKIINPTLLKTNNPFCAEIKEEKCEESLEIPKNKNLLKIQIPHDSSNDDVSTSGGSYNTPITPMTPNTQVVPLAQTDPNKNNNNIGNKLNDKVPSNNIHSSFNENRVNNDINEEKIDLYFPMAFTFNQKFNEKQNNYNNYNSNNNLSLKNNNKSTKYNNSSEERILKDKKRKSMSFNKNKDGKNKNRIDNKFDRNNNQKNYSLKENNINCNNNSIKKNNKNLNSSYNKYKSKNKNDTENRFGDIENYSQRESRKNSRPDSNLSYNRKAKSAKKAKETNNIMTVKNSNKLIKKNSKENKIDLNGKNCAKDLISKYADKKKDIVHLKVEKEINHIFKNLQDNNEIFPEVNNKFELLLKNIDDIKDAINKKKSLNLFKKTKGNLK